MKISAEQLKKIEENPIQITPNWRELNQNGEHKKFKNQTGQEGNKGQDDKNDQDWGKRHLLQAPAGKFFVQLSNIKIK